MHRSSLLSRGKCNTRGVAIIIVLAFLVLVTGLIVAFFSRAISERQVSNSSATLTKTELFAQGATDQIIGDIKQEIAAGSTITATTGLKIYAPKSATTAYPYPVGTSGTLPNLLKRSASTLPFYSGAAIYDTVNYPASNRAIGVSTLMASSNGRYISPARWNKPLLMPQNAPASDTDLTPLGATSTTWANAPDWIPFGRDGSNPTIVTTSSSATNYVIGRYAYNIYDEGGLLDVNVAGSPVNNSTAKPLGSISSYKNALAYVDLTQLPGLSTLNVSDQATVINAIVGWRNYASAGPTTGSFPSYTAFGSAVSPSTLTPFDISMLGNTGFMQTSNTALSNGQSDRMFSSRQQLIKLLQSIGTKVPGFTPAIQHQVLQYLATFTRGLEQPSYAPASTRPAVVGTMSPPSPATVNTYEGNNTYFGGASTINMTGTGGFLSVRVTIGFTRLNGTTAVVGEPLVKTKFALSNLARVTTTATATNVASDPIYARFGLFRANATQPWTYNHGTSGIMTLKQVATKAREPDFAELLKAAINIGSVGKAGPSGQGTNDQYRMDVSGDLQIFQIMANLIDQTKTDNYPTRIQYVDSNGVTRKIFGDQDLPYFYRWHFFSVATKIPTPLLSGSDQATLGPRTFNHATEKTAGMTFDAGAASYMIIPQIWNPHDANSPVASSGGPTIFRVVAENNDPTGTLGVWKICAQPSDAGGHFDGGGNGTYTQADPPASATSTPIALDSTNGFLQFSDASGGRAFREPTLLWRNGYPSGVTLSGTFRQEDASLTGNTYFGILVGDTPISWVNSYTDPSTSITKNYIFQASNMRRGVSVAGPSGSLTDNITFRMQYQDPSGNWITYQELFAEATLTNIPGHTLFVNKSEYAANNKYANPLAIGINSSGPALTAPMGGPYDPRSERFATPITGRWDTDDAVQNGNPTLGAVTMVANAISSDPTVNLAVQSSNFVLLASQRPTTARGQYNDYTTPCRGPYNTGMRWFSSVSWTTGNGQVASDTNFNDGLLSQNNPAVKILGRDGAAQKQLYYEDPDGICRRAMGGYVPVSGNASGRGTNTTTTVGLPMATSGTTFTNGIVTPTTQSQSRPIILHRPFRSVAEMSYAFRGTPWKNIDFFTPESGDTALLDVFCVNEPPTDGIVAGKVNLNSRQSPVLQAVFAGAYRDELANAGTPPSGALSAVDATEAKNLADTLVGITSGVKAWQGPLTTMGDIVGHFVSPNPASVSPTDYDVYQYTSPANNTTYTFAGFTAALGGKTPGGANIWGTNIAPSQYIQRFRESAIRPLVSCGQTRLWNLLIDVVAQSGRYPVNASTPAQFTVEGEKRFWVHVAIDRYTGEVVDKQVELVRE